jgi:protein-disulfide isomerase
MRILLLCFLAVGLMAQGGKKPSKKAVAPAAPKMDVVKLEGFLRHLNLWTPEIQFEIKDRQPASLLPGFEEITVKATLGERFVEQKYIVSGDGKTIIKGEVLDVTANPFLKENATIRNVGQPSMGTVGAPVVLSVYTDYQCPYCRDQAKVLRANLLKSYPKEVRMFVHDFPLEQIHPWAKTAAIAGRCTMLQGEDNYWKYHDWVFDNQGNLGLETFRSTLMTWAPQNGMDALQLGRCLDSKETEPQVDKDLAEGKLLGLNSTPTVYINGRKLAGSVSWEQLKKIIDVEVKYQETAKNAGDTACCSVSLATPGVK